MRAAETVHCVHCDGLVKRDSVDEAAEAVLALGEGTRLNVLFPVMSAARRGGARKRRRRRPRDAQRKRQPRPKPAAKGGDSPHAETLKARLAELRAGGFNRLWQQGRIFEFSTPESLLDLDLSAPVFVLLDRIVVSAENRARIVDAVEIAYREARRSDL